MIHFCTLFRQLEILSSDAIKNIVLLKTVLDEARKRSPPLFKKLTDLMSATDKHCYVFINEHHKYVPRRRDRPALLLVCVTCSSICSFLQDWRDVHFARHESHHYLLFCCLYPN